MRGPSAPFSPILNYTERDDAFPLCVHMTSRALPFVITCCLLGCCLNGHGRGSVSASSSCVDGSNQHNTSAVTQHLWYTGPHQRSVCRGQGRRREVCRCFTAQHWEDLYLFQHYLHSVGGGVFVELGALDGFSYSVSYFFETLQQWRGLLIEASPYNARQFQVLNQAQRSNRKRRGASFIHQAVCDTLGANGVARNVTYVTKSGTGAGILEFMPPDQQQRNKRECADHSAPATAPPDASGSAHANSSGVITAGGGRGSCTLESIRCEPLSTIFHRHHVTFIDLFVLDVEGAESNVLRTVDFSKVAVDFFVIELDGKSAEKDADVRCMLRRYGFLPLGRLDLNEVWRHSTAALRRHCYPVPPLVDVDAQVAVTRCLHSDAGAQGLGFLKPVQKTKGSRQALSCDLVPAARNERHTAVVSEPRMSHAIETTQGVHHSYAQTEEILTLPSVGAAPEYDMSTFLLGAAVVLAIGVVSLLRFACRRRRH